MDLNEEDRPLRCGVSSFGFSGTNAHVVLEEYVPSKTVHKTSDQEPHLFLLSAVNERALNDLVSMYLQFIRENRDVSIQQICYTASRGRASLDYRLAIVITSVEELYEQLEQIAQGESKLTDVYFGYAQKTEHLFSIISMPCQRQNHYVHSEKCLHEGQRSIGRDSMMAKSSPKSRYRYIHLSRRGVGSKSNNRYLRSIERKG